MKIIRWITAVLFAVTLCVFTVFFVNDRIRHDSESPVITLPSQELAASIHVTEQELLAGVTATDDRDGDLTDRILIESVSQFINPGECTVTYAVADSSGHVAKAVRTLRYTDYTPPRFKLESPLVFPADKRVDVRQLIGAVDCIDGDISDRITVESTNYTGTSVGVYTVSVQVINSRGDRINADLPIYVESNSSLAPVLDLKSPLIYVKTGERPNFQSYLTGVTLNGKPMTDYRTIISTEFNSQVPGIYTVHYYVSNAEGYNGHTVLTVIVEE